MKKNNKNEWLFAVVVFPIIWVSLLVKYLTGDGCFRGGGKIACGDQAFLMIIGWFCFSIIFPIIYFTKVLPEIKKQEKEIEDEKLRKAFEEI